MTPECGGGTGLVTVASARWNGSAARRAVSRDVLAWRKRIGPRVLPRARMHKAE